MCPKLGKRREIESDEVRRRDVSAAVPTAGVFDSGGGPERFFPGMHQADATLNPGDSEVRTGFGRIRISC